MVYEKGTSASLFASIDFVHITIPQATNSSDSLPTYVTWANNNFSISQLTNPAISALTANPSGDGIPNLMKFAQNLNPFTSAAAQAPTLAVSGSNLLFTYRQNDSATDLKNWTPVNLAPTKLSDDGLTSVLQLSVPVKGQATLMLRLKVTGD